MQSLAQSDLHTQVVFTPVMVDVTFLSPPGVPPGGKWITTTECGPSGMLKEIWCSTPPGVVYGVLRRRAAFLRFKPSSISEDRDSVAHLFASQRSVGHGALERVDPG
jgi:hypothetical protein